ncbi:MAG: hypothetical protein ABW087_21220, partial [Candidatus Thiodiazotropha sp.]
FVFSMFYGETIVTKTIDYQASFLILNGTAVAYRVKLSGMPQAEFDELVKDLWSKGVNCRAP